MARQRNMVVLDGPISLQEVRTVEIDGSDVMAVVCWIETDRPALGGRHCVLTYGHLARKVVAFLRAAEGGRVNVTVDGWLRSADQGGVVVADRISFHTAPEVVALARRWLSEDGG